MTLAGEVRLRRIGAGLAGRRGDELMNSGGQTGPSLPVGRDCESLLSMLWSRACHRRLNAVRSRGSGAFVQPSRFFISGDGGPTVGAGSRVRGTSGSPVKWSLSLLPAAASWDS